VDSSADSEVGESEALRQPHSDAEQLGVAGFDLVHEAADHEHAPAFDPLRSKFRDTI
jgi:hypothetical protein